MKNRKQLLADFYLELLKIDGLDKLREATVLALADELKESPITVNRIFERMAAEDAR